MKHYTPLIITACLAIAPAQAADITVSAAASLSDAFKEIATQYQQRYPQDKVKLNTAASGVLLQQLAHGAPVDILATADQATMDKAEQQHLIQPNSRISFAKNTLVLITPKNATPPLKKWQDIQQNHVKRIAIGKPESVPAGAYAQSALNQAQLWNAVKPKLVYTQNVRQALDYATRGEVDAAFVYQTDAQLKSFALQVVQTVPTHTAIIYPIAISQSSKEVAAAKRFVDFVRSTNGQKVLQRYGFSQP